MQIPKNAIVRISENAMIQMCLSGLEAYCIKHFPHKSLKKRRRVETYGSLWGYSVKQPETDTPLYCVEMISVDTSADKRTNECEPDYEALSLKKNVITSIWPQYKFIGDFHTHPCKYSRGVIITRKRYEFSVQDIKSIEDYSEQWLKLDYKVGLVMTIAELSKKGTKPFNWIESNTMEFTFGKFRIWLHALVSRKVKRKGNYLLKFNYDNGIKTYLECPSIMGLSTVYDDILLT